MKWQHLVILAIVTTVSVGCTKEEIPNAVETPASTTKTVASPSAVTGNFQAGEHPTQGKVTVVTADSKQYLEFDDNFKTDNGPDLFVILYRGDKPPISGIKEQDYVNIAPLKKVSGKQRYAIPNNVKLANYKSVAIWCRKFNATFGYANL